MEGKDQAEIRIDTCQKNNENATPREAREVLEAVALSVPKANY